MAFVYRQHFEMIFLNENFIILIKILLKHVGENSVDKESAMVHVMPWYSTGDKPMSEPVMTNQARHIYITQP